MRLKRYDFFTRNPFEYLHLKRKQTKTYVSSNHYS